MSALELRSLLEPLHVREVRFIGGVAVAAGYVRGTADLDLAPDPGPQNLKRVAQGRPEDRAALAKLPESGA